LLPARWLLLLFIGEHFHQLQVCCNSTYMPKQHISCNIPSSYMPNKDIVRRSTSTKGLFIPSSFLSPPFRLLFILLSTSDSHFILCALCVSVAILFFSERLKGDCFAPSLRETLRRGKSLAMTSCITLNFQLLTNIRHPDNRQLPTGIRQLSTVNP
jgi:hypothetical protein